MPDFSAVYPGKSIFSSSTALRSLLKARASICRIRSFVTPISAPNLLQRQRLLPPLQAETSNDNLLLALVKPLQDLLHLGLPLRLRRLLLELVAAVVLGGC